MEADQQEEEEEKEGGNARTSMDILPTINEMLPSRTSSALRRRQAARRQ
jgi:hypothetical protein